MGWIFLIGVILLFGIAALLEFLMFSTTKKEEKEDAFITRTHVPKRRTILCLIITLVLVVSFMSGTVAIILFDNSNEVSFWIAYTLGCLFVISVPMILLLICISDYEVIMNNGIYVHRIFRKKFIKFNELSSYSYSFNQLTVFDKSDKPVIFVADMRIGLKSLISELEYHGIHKKIN